MMDQLNEGVYKIRPAARIIHTIGSDLIGDSYSALVELVKNSYDADATKVEINFNFKVIDNENALVITIKDNGHGMSFDTVINKWLVPATDDKLKRKKSPNKKRAFQGRKGIGRFAASILGQEMTLSSVDESGEKTTVVIDWRIFNTDDFLENVELLVEKQITNELSGTILEIVAKKENSEDKISIWDKKAIENLVLELRKLISPFEQFTNDTFQIDISFTNSPFTELKDYYTIETYPIIELYDYRISGSVDEKGNATLLFENNVNPRFKQTEEIKTHFELKGNGKYCGNIKFDFRVFDRETDAIDNLINKGLIDPISQKYMGKNEARRLLNEVYGVNIYKSFFRIRPYGNAGVDWLDLDKDRIQNFSLRISNNQIVGFITIQPEELSNLEEKSARDGLKENDYYFGLKELAKRVLAELEHRRFAYRTKSEKSRGKKKGFQGTIEQLFSFSDLKNSIGTTLKSLNVNQETINEIDSILQKEEQSKIELKEELIKTIAIYQGQATLGKIVNFILHEGRKPIQFFNSETKVIERYIRHFKITKNEELLEDLDQSIDGFRKNSKLISELFNRINPLAKQKRGNKNNFLLNKTILESFKIFRSTLNEIGIEVLNECDPEITVFGWEDDLFTALTNLIENSIYWLSLSRNDEKRISMQVTKSSNSIIIDYKDNGPGLTDLEIESDVIFEPGYSKKLDGTGLGLAIAGEAIERLNGKLKALKYPKGAYFQIEITQ
ncbi:MAG: sensor histidine kinase [Cyclobacteriaceae bacterium]|nr:sensor histidine kinase [Cyclobacteriaceae bacterium]